MDLICTSLSHYCIPLTNPNHHNLQVYMVLHKSTLKSCGEKKKKAVKLHNMYQKCKLKESKDFSNEKL